MAKKIRLDHLLVERGLAETRSKAQALILAGQVRVDGVVRTKSGEQVGKESAVVVEESLRYASRGGFKLAHALDTFGLSPDGLVALDVGASTGGFTDVLLQRGAAYVYAVDVGYGLIDWRLRQDPRVILLERTNIRYLDRLPLLDTMPVELQALPDELPSAKALPSIKAQSATIDVSFISLRLVLPAVQHLIAPDAWVVPLIKPQFEAGAEHVGKGGVVRDRSVHAAVLLDVLGFAAGIGLQLQGLTRSPITGPAGNIEFLAWLSCAAPQRDLEQSIRAVLAMD